MDDRVKQTYAKDSRATNKNALADVYVKFFRWATDRLKGRDGIVCYVSNNSFVDQAAFDGMRKHLQQDFTALYHLDLHGNVRKNPKLSGTTHNVFGIQVGVGLTIAVRRAQPDPPNPPQAGGRQPTSLAPRRRQPHPPACGGQRGVSGPILRYHRVPEMWRKEQKLDFLSQAGHIYGVAWQDLQPDAKHTWLTEGMQNDFASFLPMGTKETKAARDVDVEAIFKNYGRGVATSRDEWAYDFDRANLIKEITHFIENYNAEVDRWKRRIDKTSTVDDFVTSDETRLKWSRDLKLDLQRGNPAEFSQAKIRKALYRPFVHRVFVKRKIGSPALLLNRGLLGSENTLAK